LDVIFSDETTVRLSDIVPHAKYKIYARNKDEIKNNVVLKNIKSPSIHIWGAICGSRKSSLHFFKSTVTTKAYVLALRKHMISFWKKCKPKVFQHDNAPPHRSKITQQFFSDSKIKSVQWPPYSPDLNPIEKVWAILKERLSLYTVSTLSQLKIVLKHLWDSMPDTTIRKLTNSHIKKIKMLKNITL
jgi:transposase